MARIDRLLSVNIVHPVRKAVCPLPDRAVPILMYHSISDATEDYVPPYFRVTTKPQTFERHLAILAGRGYVVRPLREIGSLLENAGTPKKSVVMTFDDGFKDIATTVAPLLGRYGWAATVFLPTHHIDHPDQGLAKGKIHLGWGDVRELVSTGIEFGSHTVNHPMLRYCDRTVIEREVTESKKIIEDKTGVPVVSFSNPYRLPFEDGETLRFLTDCLRRAGYVYAVSTVVGIVQGLNKGYFLPRLPVNNDDDDRLFIAKLEGAYSWVNIPQYCVRIVKKTLGIKPRGKRF